MAKVTSKVTKRNEKERERDRDQPQKKLLDLWISANKAEESIKSLGVSPLSILVAWAEGVQRESR